MMSCDDAVTLPNTQAMGGASGEPRSPRASSCFGEREAGLTGPRGGKVAANRGMRLARNCTQWSSGYTHKREPGTQGRAPSCPIYT
jgi:hypothetical protein